MKTHSTTRRFWPALRSRGRDIMLIVFGLLLGVFLVASPAAHAQHSGAAGRQRTGSRAAAPVPTIDKLREQAVNAVSPSVVEVINVGKDLGSGEIITKNGYIVTNNHVVAGAKQIAVALQNGQTISATLTGADPVDDLAVIKINAGSNLPTVAFGDSSQLKVGQTVLALGNPLGIVHTVTDGIVSALNRVVQEGQNTQGRILNAIQTSAPINPGNSGGALITLGGKLIGIPTLTAIDPQFKAPASGVGFAIPANRVKNITSQIIKYGKVMHSGIADLGIRGAQVTPQLARQYNLPVAYGVLVAGFAAVSPAQQAGVPKGAIIVKVDNTPITSYDALLTVLSEKKPGDKVTLIALAPPSGAKHTYTVTLGELNVNG